ncbi:MAG: PAS domain S-box protein [Polyangiaceae bacterium]|nr:PAS domain S-box protein [Polyangiaceae bacterium]
MTRVLVVDDLEPNRYLLRALLSASGFEVEEAANGEEALALARANPPQLCISDLLMPVKDGFDLLREWKSDPTLWLVPFVVYSATYTDAADERVALDLGADAFIVKPAEPDEFVARVRAVLASVPAAQPARAPVLDPSAGRDAHRQALARKLAQKVMALESANLELSIRNAQLATVLRTEPEAVLVLTAEGRIAQVNDAGLRLLEAAGTRDLAGLELASLVVEEDRGRFRETLRTVLAGQPQRIEHRAVGLGGSLRWVETHANVLSDGEQPSVLCVARDMTERLLVSEAQERERALSSAILRGLPGIFYMFDEAGRFVRWNERFETVTGYSGDEVTRLHPVELFEGDEQAYIAGRIAEVFTRGESDAEATLVSKTGTRTPYYFTGVRSEIGGKVYLAGTGVDLSARRRAEAALERVAAWQRAMLDATDLAIISTDVEGVVQSFNSASEHLFGYRAEEMVGKESPAILHVPEEVAARAAELTRVSGWPVEPGFEVFVHEARAGKAAEHEWTCVRQDGTRFPARVSVSAMRDAQGTCIGFLGIATDLTAVRQQEATRRLQAAALDAAANSMLIADRQGIIQWVNPAFTALTGYSADEAIGRKTSILKSGLQSAEFYADLWQTVLAGRVWRAELVNRRKDGSLYHEEETITPLLDDAGAITHFVAIKQDISDRKRAEMEQWKLEEQLRVSEKLRAVGSLAGGIAHDFNNILAVILTYAEVAMEALPPGEPARDDILEIKSAGERAAELTRQLLAFSRRQVMRVESVNLNQVASGLEKMLRRLLGEHIELELTLLPSLGLTRADPSQIEQVIVNLAVNARDAMPEGGKLTVETTEVTLDSEYVAMHPGVQPGQYVVLAVTDTGVGMDDSVRQRIFEPFFTTKAQGKGTGLGLATVHGIVEQSGGRVWVYSEVGAGTTFKIYLPRLAEGQEAERNRAVAAARVGGSETVLLVEDEQPVRNIVERVLRAAGYRVITAQNGEVALTVAARHPGEIELVLTDVAMPKLGGRALVEQLTRVRPAIKALFMSGYADDAIVNHGVLDAGLHFIGKPFGVGELLRKVREVLDDQSSPKA